MVYCFERTFEILDLKVGEIGNIQDPQVKVFPLDENLNAWKIINLSPKTWFYEGKIIINSNRGPNFELHLKKKNISVQQKANVGDKPSRNANNCKSASYCL